MTTGRVSVQVCRAPDGAGYLGYVPDSDTEAHHPTFDGARIAALEAHKKKGNTPMDNTPKDQATTQWTCNNGHENPPGRTDCATCGTPML